MTSGHGGLGRAVAASLIGLVVGGAVLVAARPAGAQELQLTGELVHQSYRLANGLRVIVREDRRSPFVSVRVVYEVGSAYDPPGRAGLAHLCEHIAVQGSAHIPNPGRHLLAVGNRETILALTWLTRTIYGATVPAADLETVLWIESDRMGFLSATSNALVRSQGVVLNEHRQRSNDRFLRTRGVIFEALFAPGHPLRLLWLDRPEEVGRVQVGETAAFVERYYRPSNAILVVVGDIDRERVRTLVDRYFGSLPTLPRPTPPEVRPVEPTGEVVRHVRQPHFGARAIVLGWPTPAFFAPGDAAADVLAEILAGRLRVALGPRVGISARQDSLRWQSVFHLAAIGAGGAGASEPAQLLTRIDEVLAAIRRDGPTEAEVQRARAQWLRYTVQGLDGLLPTGVAAQLAAYAHATGRGDYLAEDIARYRAVTAEEVKRFATEVLATHRRVVVFVESDESARGPLRGAASP